jgi:hypothetical protein
VGSSLADKDAQKNKCVDPRVLFERVDELESENGHDVGDDGNDDDANRDAHGVVGHCTQDLSYDDVVDDGKTTSDDNVEDTTELGSPEAE